MTDLVHLHLDPGDRRSPVPAGARLQDVLFDQGAEFPCGGAGDCGKCSVLVVEGRLDPTDDDYAVLGKQAVATGWRLACRARLFHDVRLRLSQWDAPVLGSDAPIDIVPRPGWGIAVDLGTTTIAAQLIDLSTGTILGVETATNPQVAFGADVMTRIHAALSEEGARTQTKVIRDCLGDLAGSLVGAAQRGNGLPEHPLNVVVVANTVMHHLLAGYDIAGLAVSPFMPTQLDETVLDASEWGWLLPRACEVRILPCLGGFVGSDLLAGIMASGLDQGSGVRVLVDLGTNGEIVVTDGQRMLCTATAAGPAFEGARIRMGMRAATGAIDRVWLANGKEPRLCCHVIGGESSRGVCGSGLVDAAACALDAGLLYSSGRLAKNAEWLSLTNEVALHQCDIRELQLAKGAIAAGVEILLRQIHAKPDDVETAYLCGAFGNYLNVAHARRIGLLPVAESSVRTLGNSALHGAKIALLAGRQADLRIDEIRQRAEVVNLHNAPEFMDCYVRHMSFSPVGASQT